MTLPELVESYREFAALTVSALQESARRDGPLAIAQVRLVVGIDEIDRIEDAENAEKFLNDIKAIFGIPNCFYIASLSADALANFERRVVSTRTAFDTTFDTVLRIGPLELDIARQVLERRAIGLPYPFITLCYVLSGGVPRELMRIARAIFDVRNDIRFSADEGNEREVALAVIAPRVIGREMESLRQGLMPLATQLNVPGATELIGLLDDPDWPSMDLPHDLAKLSKVTGQRALFQDESGNIAGAAKICDGLVVTNYGSRDLCGCRCLTGCRFRGHGVRCRAGAADRGVGGAVAGADRASPRRSASGGRGGGEARDRGVPARTRRTT